MVNPVGEDNWLAYLKETIGNSTDLEQRVNVVELYKHAVSAEPGSLRLWLAYCDYFWSLWLHCQSGENGWSEVEQMMGRELFSIGVALDLWQQGYEAIKYRLDDSHVLWDRWISLELELLAKSKTPDGVKRITHLFCERLVIPHLNWNDTAQIYSTFLSQYNPSSWENSMKDVTIRSQDAKRLVAARDSFEFKLKQATRANNVEALKAAMTGYLEWEMLQSREDNGYVEIAGDLCGGLFARALTGVFATDEAVWQEYIVFLSSHLYAHTPTKLLDVLRRAVQHCPWSGRLWNRLILCAEESKLDFSEVESIKHAAATENKLYENSMESMIDMYVAWCGFLKRTAMDPSATDEAIDVADIGLSAALKDVKVVGQRLYGKDFQGDPKFRLEQIYIQYLTEKKGAIEEARAQWTKLASIQIHADSYDFWFRYYMWEMLIFSSNNLVSRSSIPSSVNVGFRTPNLATAILREAIARRSIDWPEKVLEVYMQHCNNYEPSLSVRMATDTVQNAEKLVFERRTHELEAKNAAYATFYGEQKAEQVADTGVTLPTVPKRKRVSLHGAQEEDGSARKRQKSVQEVSEPLPELERDRENSTVIVTNLPLEVTQTKIRQYFKEYGHINNITALVRDEGGQSSTAMIEFSSPDEAQSALLRDSKHFGLYQISVQSGHDLTVYVANYPPTADEKYIRRLFQNCGDILNVRWPSLRVNTHRRFCYVSFRNRQGSAMAVQKEGIVLHGNYKLLVKYSDPAHKKIREGAVAEGREVHVTGLSPIATEDGIREVFSKYGTVTRINIPQSMAGKNRGFAFIDFEDKAQAQKAASELNNTKYLNQILQVEVSIISKVKPLAHNISSSYTSASPTLSTCDAEGDVATASSVKKRPLRTTPAEIAARTIALMGLPDTVNDARVRALVEPLGAIVKIILQPMRGGARIELADSATAGKVGMQLSNVMFEGHRLRVGSLEELRHAQPERTQDRIVYGSKGMKQKDAGAMVSAKGLILPPAIRRPALGNKPGPKRGLGSIPRKPMSATSGGTEVDKFHVDGNMAQDNVKPAPKSNADFKKMFLTGSISKKTDEDAR